jgi:hypothetical protein
MENLKLFTEALDSGADLGTIPCDEMAELGKECSVCNRTQCNE